MITIDTLNQDSALRELSEEQKKAICTISENDEKQTFGAKFAQIHSELDETIKGITGIGKENNEKTSDYLRRMLEADKSSIASLNEEVNGLKVKNDSLEQQIKDGSADKEILRTKDATIADLTSRYNALKEASEKADKAHADALFSMRVDNELMNAMNGIQFKDGYNEQMLSMVKNNAILSVKANKLGYEKDDNGRDTLYFYDKNGAKMLNAEKQLNPYTATDMLINVLKGYGVVEDKSHGGGAGGRGGKKGNNAVLDLSGAGTRVRALEMIEEHLAAKGMVRGTLEYDREKTRIWSENSAVLPK